MSKNYIGVIVVLILLIIGGWLITRNGTFDTNGITATTTNISNTGNTPNNSYQTPVVVNQPGLPVVETDQNAVPTKSTAVLTGRVTPNGALTTYWYEYGESNSLGQKTSTQSIGSGFSKVGAPAFITALKANTLYYFRLNAQNHFGTVTGSTYSFTTNNNPPVQAITPTTTTLAATGISRMAVTLNGQVNPNGTVASYWFEYGKDSNLGNTTGVQSAGNGSSLVPVSVSLSDLTGLTKYYYRLNTQNEFGTVNGTIMSFTTSGPASPTSPAVQTMNASQVTSTSATLNGKITPNGADTTYWFEYSEDSLLGNIIGTITATQSVSATTGSMNVSANTTGLNGKTKYFYRLVGRNQIGTTKGGTVSFTTK